MLVWQVGTGPHVSCLESLQVCLLTMTGAWPLWPCTYSLHEGALLGTGLFAVPFNECEAPVSFGGVATTQCAGVGTANSRLLRAESCSKHRLLTMRAGQLPLCGLAFSRPRLGGVDKAAVHDSPTLPSFAITWWDRRSWHAELQIVACAQQLCIIPVML